MKIPKEELELQYDIGNCVTFRSEAGSATHAEAPQAKKAKKRIPIDGLLPSSLDIATMDIQGDHPIKPTKEDAVESEMNCWLSRTATIFVAEDGTLGSMLDFWKGGTRIVLPCNIGCGLDIDTSVYSLSFTLYRLLFVLYSFPFLLILIHLQPRSIREHQRSRTFPHINHVMNQMESKH